MAKARAGVAYLKVDGRQHDLSGTMTIGMGTLERETIIGLDGIHGFKETPKPPFIEGEFVRNPELPLQKLEQLTDVTVTAELIDGMIYTLANAWVMGGPELDAAEGKYTLRFEGEQIQESGAPVNNG